MYYFTRKKGHKLARKESFFFYLSTNEDERHGASIALLPDYCKKIKQFWTFW